MGYLFISFAVVMFGVQFLLSDKYGERMGNAAPAAFLLSLLSAIGGGVCLFVISAVRFGIRFEFTWFTLAMATVAAINMLLYTLFSLKALAKINLSLYSLFAMLGGMLLPFLYGLVFGGEGMSVAKALCLVFIAAALLLTIDFGRSESGDEASSKKKGAARFYIGVFILNGMGGVIANIFKNTDLPKTSDETYSLMIAIVSAVLSLIAVLILRKNFKRPTKSAFCIALGSGSLNQVANFLLLLALTTLPATVQYPFVTGGVMIVSTVISAITGQRPTKREIISVSLAFIGVVLLVAVPV